MGLQARMSESDPRMYNVNRDCAHNFEYVMKEVASRLEDGRWAYLDALLKEKGVTLEQLGLACAAACKFVHAACENPKEKMGECLARSGFWDVPELASVALSAYVGTIMFGMFWVGAREATLGGVGPCTNMEGLREAGERAHRLITMSPWRRRWERVKARYARSGTLCEESEA